jgi:hypothetical protein
VKPKIVDADERLVYGEVYVPYRIDTDMEYATPEEIEKAAHYFMSQSKMGNIDSEHNFKSTSNIVVESYIVKENDPLGYVPGSWVAAGKIEDDQQWEDIKSGKLNGWSMAGHSDKQPRKVKVVALISAVIKTEESTADIVEPHSHDLVLKFDNGKVIPTTTSEVLNHSHQVVATTATEQAEGHSHRFNFDWSNDSDSITKEEREIDAVELINIRPQWLSLVEHAATRRAFTLIKGDVVVAEKEAPALDRVVHAIVSDMEFDEVVKMEDMDWMVPSDVHFEERLRIGSSNKYVLIPSQNFVKGSLETRETVKPNVKVVVGVLKEESTKNAILAEEVNAMDEAKVLEIVEKALTDKLSDLMKTELDAWKEDFSKSVETLKTEIDSLISPKVEEGQKPINDTLSEIKTMIESMKAEQTAIVTKTEELSHKAATLTGTAEQTETIKKSEPTEKPSWLMKNNSRVQEILSK